MKKLLAILILLTPMILLAQKTINICDNNATAFAYVSSPGTTTTTNTGEYYYLQGSFTNETMSGWAIVGDTLTYQGVEADIMIVLHGSFSTDTNNTEITIGIKKNGVIEVNSQMTVEINSTTDIANLSTCDVIRMKNGDNLSLWIKSDKAGAQITTETFTTTAFSR